MKFRFHSALLAIALVLGAGCNRQASVDVPVTAPIAISSQLEAAMAIQNPIQRDEALSAVAQTAADAGDGGIAMKAAAAIANPIVKDDTAAVSAKKLAKFGKGTEATAIAKIIQNPIKRDKALLDLAKP
jgi:hypothetical protein